MAIEQPHRRILIAEDHRDSRDALRVLLESLGYEVVVAINGREAVEVAVREVPDLILMDVMMPEMDGLEATRRLRDLPTFRTVPIVAVTAMEGAHEAVYAAGCDDFVAKPINIRKFLSTLPSWFAEPMSLPA
jgi:two-component system, cell cycle response regulator DivK